MFRHTITVRNLYVLSQRSHRISLPKFSNYQRTKGYGFFSTSHQNSNSNPNTRTTSIIAILAAGFVGGLSVPVTGYLIDNYLPPDFFSSYRPNSSAKLAGPKEVQSAIAELLQEFPAPDQVLTREDILTTYGSSDNTYHPSHPHAVIVVPDSTEDVVKIVNIARKWRVPIVPYSGATSLEGHFSGVSTGSICIDMSSMNQILQIHEQDADVVVQPGLSWEDLNATLKEKGIPFFFPLDPGPGATIGGMIATGCSGTNAVRYGTAKSEWFLNFTVVLPSGEIIKTRQRARKSSAGFDLTKLFIGAEGTLGIVTEATLRLAPVLPTRVAMAQFPDVQKAVDAVQEILTSEYGSHVQCIELLDSQMMSCISTSGTLPPSRKLPPSDSLFFKLQGSPDSIFRASKLIKSIVKKHGSSKFEFANDEGDADMLWQNRKEALYATLGANSGMKCWTTDVCVPVSKLPQLVYETKEDLQQSGIKNTILGHVGDGNFHALLLFHEDNEEEFEAVKEAVHRMVERAQTLEGTCTGEHGVGIGKKAYLPIELGPGTVKLMKKIKRLIDPLGIMNPGKLYPDDD